MGLLSMRAAASTSCAATRFSRTTSATRTLALTRTRIAGAASVIGRRRRAKLSSSFLGVGRLKINLAFFQKFVYNKSTEKKKRRKNPKMKTIANILLICCAIVAIILALAIYVNPLALTTYVIIALIMLALVCLGLIFNTL